MRDQPTTTEGNDMGQPNEYVDWTDRTAGADEWECPDCYAENHPAYGQCWQCERDR